MNRHWEGNLNLHRTVAGSSIFGNSNGVTAAMKHLHGAVQPVQL
jgi:hypothetical protein